MPIKNSPPGLLKLGAQVQDIAVYKTGPELGTAAQIIKLFRSGEIDVVTFTSSSTVSNLMAALENSNVSLNGVKVACIGPKTADTALKAGLKVDILAGTTDYSRFGRSNRKIFQKGDNMSNFPEMRMRRLRRTPNLRNLFQETTLEAGDFIYPLFITEGHNIKQDIASMPGISRFSTDLLAKEAEEIVKLGIPAVILFGIPSHKDEVGSEAYNPNGAVQQAIKILKKEVPELIVVNDVCLCEYTNHGHCGFVTDGYVDNDKTLELLAKTAVSYAEAGSDMVAPSDMMDGRVGAIRKALDKNGFPSYSYLCLFR